ncbi:putative transcriptional regulatory protein C1F7,11c [Talaromyces islandicus]|uniref:Putative transcriptional regulatory protein C1F7,11c n=1 Tax=Talaromyces islandicus TaxID=28573 RepID=A0A0U1M8H3_TALIS|nr:putative transcriptional regulatory protein C1F7,11c [Talaromyces islandicus]
MSAVTRSYKVGRRNRLPLSCDPCRTRKLKCNREQPCQNCTARDELSTCKYKGSRNVSAPTAHREVHRDSMQQRINNLETLVKKLIDTQHKDSYHGSSDAGSPRPKSAYAAIDVASDASDVAHSTGTTVIDSTHSVYRGADDWYDVLQEINQLKKFWNQSQDESGYHDVQPNLSHTVDGSSLLFGHVKPIEKIEILATLPPKPEVDRLISWFFDRDNFPIIVPPILHEATFMSEYDEHWKNPSNTNIIWLGLLFSILGITMLAYRQMDEPPEYEGRSESLLQLYRIRTAQCLLVGDIAKCLPYTLETLRFNATAELNRKDDNSRGLWIMTGVIMRVAINMGYHRDPSQLPSISALQCEFRRRIWLSVASMDDVASFRGGFPRMIPAIYSDTLEPRNLHDWELFLDENKTNLPPSRPLTEFTPVSYMIAKGRLFRVLGRIADFNNNTALNSTYETVLEIDKALYNVHSQIPPYMQIHLGEDTDKFQFNQTGKLAFSSLGAECAYHKGMCTLHRRFMVKARFNSQFDLSRKRCIESALALLECQRFLIPTWYQYSHSRQMLVLAAMVLFLELELRRRDSTDMQASYPILNALGKSCEFWKDARSSCEDASRIYQTLARMLSGFQDDYIKSSTAAITATSPSHAIITPESLEECPRSTLSSSSYQPIYEEKGFSLERDLFTMPNDMEIDWATWDSFIEGNSFEDGVLH